MEGARQLRRGYGLAPSAFRPCPATSCLTATGGQIAYLYPDLGLQSHSQSLLRDLAQQLLPKRLDRFAHDFHFFIIFLEWHYLLSFFFTIAVFTISNIDSATLFLYSCVFTN